MVVIAFAEFAVLRGSPEKMDLLTGQVKTM
jgi:hypothetical protein